MGSHIDFPSVMFNQQSPQHKENIAVKEILLPLNGSTIKCKIGFGVTIAAADHIRELRKANYRKDREMVAELGVSVAPHAEMG